MARNRYDIDEDLESPFSLTHLRRCGVYIKRYLRRILTSILLSAAANIAILSVPLLMKNVIDFGIPAGDAVAVPAQKR